MMVCNLVLALIFFYYRKGDTYEDVVLAEFRNDNFGCNGLKGCDLGIQVRIPMSWENAKLILSEDLKLRVTFLILRDSLESPSPRTLNQLSCRRYPSLDYLVFLDILIVLGGHRKYKVLYLAMSGARFYLRMGGYFLVFYSVRRHIPYAPYGEFRRHSYGAPKG